MLSLKLTHGDKVSEIEISPKHYKHLKKEIDYLQTKINNETPTKEDLIKRGFTMYKEDAKYEYYKRGEVGGIIETAMLLT